MFEVKDLNTFLYQDGVYLPVVRDVSFHIESGNLLGLIGESGSGKTVTGLSIAGIHRPPQWRVTGEVLLDGAPLPLQNDSKMRPLRGQDICFIMQNPMSAFDPLFTIRDHFRETRSAHGELNRVESDQLAVELLDRLRISDPRKVLKSYPFECSGGMLQRIMIAIAVMNRPKLLIADEPTTALDRTVQYEIIRLIGELKDTGSAILFVSHDLQAVSYIADELAVMYGGYIVEHGPVLDIMKNPCHPYTQALIGAVPQFSKDFLPILDGMPPSLKQRPSQGCPFAPRCSIKQDGCENFCMECAERGGRLIRCVQSPPGRH